MSEEETTKFKSSSQGVIMPHVVSPEVTGGDVKTPQIMQPEGRTEGEKSSSKSESETIGTSIGCGCLTTLILAFVAYEYIYLRLREGFTSLQVVGFWSNFLFGIPLVFIATSAAFEGVFCLMRFLRSRIRSLWKKKNHGETKDSSRTG